MIEHGIIPRLDLDRRTINRVTPASRVGLLTALDVCGALQIFDKILRRDILSRPKLLRSGVDAGGTCEHFAFEKVVNARRKNHPVVNQNSRAQDDDEHRWNGDVRPRQKSQEPPAETSFRFSVTNDLGRRLRDASHNARVVNVWWPPQWHSKSRGRSVWRRAVSSDAKRLGWYCLETIDRVYCMG